MARLEVRGDVMSEARDAKGMSRGALADATGYTSERIRQFERGVSPGIPEHRARLIATVLEIDLEELVQEQEGAA